MHTIIVLVEALGTAGGILALAVGAIWLRKQRRMDRQAREVDRSRRGAEIYRIR
jgi:hypothetical protein